MTAFALLVGTAGPTAEPAPARAPSVIDRERTHPCPPGYRLWFTAGDRALCVLPRPEESP